MPDLKPVFAIDRAILTRATLVATVKFHLKFGSIVQVHDRDRAHDLCYEMRPFKGAIQVIDAACLTIASTQTSPPPSPSQRA